jgi:hypothetical protein
LNPQSNIFYERPGFSQCRETPLSEPPHQFSLFNSLPNEIQDMVILQELKIQHDHSAPPILVALGTSKDRRRYEVARRKYLDINFIATSQNEDIFHKMKLRDLDQIRHLEIVTPLRIRGHKMFCRNGLETVIVDASNRLQPEDGRGLDVTLLVQWLVLASRAARTVILKSCNDHWSREDAVVIDRGLGFKGREETRAGMHMFIWEGRKQLGWAPGAWDNGR